MVKVAAAARAGEYIFNLFSLLLMLHSALIASSRSLPAVASSPPLCFAGRRALHNANPATERENVVPSASPHVGVMNRIALAASDAFVTRFIYRYGSCVCFI